MAANCQERLASLILAERILFATAHFNCNNNGAVGATVLHTRHAELQAHVHGNAWKTSAAGNWTRVFRVTGGNTNHYTTTELKPLDLPACWQTHCQEHWVWILIWFWFWCGYGVWICSGFKKKLLFCFWFDLCWYGLGSFVFIYMLMLKFILIMFRFEQLILNWKYNLILTLMCTSYCCMSMLDSILISSFILISISLLTLIVIWLLGFN